VCAAGIILFRWVATKITACFVRGVCQQSEEIRLKKKYTKKDLSLFKKIVLARKEDILEGIKHISDDTLKKSQKDAAGDISGYTYHMADVATDTYDREFSLGLASSDRELLYEFDDALKKIEDGSFGICEQCKALITKTRLKAIPQARLCVKCQEKKEKR
jgi:DnaK suppressor protein